MVSLLHKKTSEIGKNCIIGCYIPWLKDDSFAVTDIGVEMLMYVQIFILVKAAFFLEAIQRFSLIIKKPKHTKQGRYIDETNEKSGNYCK